MFLQEKPTILAIDTSCDETSAAVTCGTKILSNVVWSQASAHAKFGGVMPSLAQRMHEERIDWVVTKALRQAKCDKIQSVAVTAGPGLAIALGVGINKAKNIARELKVSLVEINHIEGHLLSAWNEKVSFPAWGLVVSGGHTELVYMEKIGKYKIIAATQDDALGEALDKAARMLGLGYPGGAFLEKLAREGDPKHYPLPLPMAGRENENKFSYSGLKTALFRSVDSLGQSLSKDQICDLAASFQDMAFKHLIRVITRTIENGNIQVKDFLVGGGVIANLELRKRLRSLGKELGMKVHFPANKKLCGDNAGMIGIAAGLRYSYQLPVFSTSPKATLGTGSTQDIDKIDRKPRWKVDEMANVV